MFVCATFAFVSFGLEMPLHHQLPLLLLSPASLQVHA
jgi:hypothetical protein